MNQVIPLRQSPRYAVLASTSLTFLKPLFRRILRPVAARLARAGVTANQVTLASLVGSIAVSSYVCSHARWTLIFAVLPIWLLLRMCCATIDGTLAIEFGQKSRIGGILNEAGDIISDAALFLPLAFVKPLSIAPVLFLIGFATYAEIVGLYSGALGRGRRLEGPLGKADRTIALAIISMTIAIVGRLPLGMTAIFPALLAGLALTTWNRIQFAAAERPERKML